MKKFITLIFIVLSLLIGTASADYMPDLVVTDVNGIWTDSRAFVNVNAAITAIGANERTLVIAAPQVVTTLAVPANVTLKFERNGSITNSGQLTINSKRIIASNRQIFTGIGNIDFAAGTVVKSGWFQNIESAFALTVNDEVTIVISNPANVTASFSPGNDVTLRWESPGNALSVNAGVILGNIKNIEAGRYLLFTGAGDIDFLDGTQLNLSWFERLRSVVTWVENEEVTLVVDEPSTVTFDNTLTTNISLVVHKGGLFTVDTGIVLTINGPLTAGLYQIFEAPGTTNLGFGAAKIVYPQWFGAVGNGVTDDRDAIQATIGGAPTGGTIVVPETATRYIVTIPTDLTDALTVSRRMTIVINGELRFDTALAPLNQANPPYIMNITVDDVVLKGSGTLIGNGTYVVNETTTDNCPGLLRVTGDNVTIEGLTFVNPQEIAIYLRGANRALVTGCKFTGGPLVGAATSAQHYYVMAGGSTDHVTVTNNRFYMSAAGGSARNAVTYDGANVYWMSVTDNKFKDIHEHAIYMYGRYGICSNNTIEYTKLYAAQLGNAIKFGGRYNVITGNTIHNALKGGIQADDAVGTVISNNILNEVGHDGISLSHDSFTTGFDNNIISHNYVVASGGTDYSGISMLMVAIAGPTAPTANCYGNRIIGNTFIGWGNVGLSRETIRIEGYDATYNFEDLQIKDNYITGSLYNGIILSRVKRSIVSDNVFYYNPMVNFHGIYAANCDDLRYESNTFDDYVPAPTLQNAFSFATVTDVWMLNNECFNASANNPFAHDTANNIIGRGNKISRDYALIGAFGMNADISHVVPNENIVDVGLTNEVSFILITPMNAAAATAMGSVKALYMSAATAGTSFTMTTADGVAVPGVDHSFAYEIIQ